tara:strand:- start:252753 stop:253898 length:1146 start_codon:yes stop_codon:yes gene_type:complete
MLVVTYIQNMKELGLAKEHGVSEVIISPKGPSRFGTLKDSEVNELGRQAKEIGLKSVLELDALLTEQELLNVDLKSYELSNFDALRVQDPGLLELVLHKTKLPVQLILEGGNHNLPGLMEWRDYLGPRLDRMVLSIELPKDKLQEYKEALSVPVEFLVLGRILLFYTPRNLLSAMLPEDDELRTKPQITAVGESEESPHKGFPVLENNRGTFMFHIKHQFLMEHLSELQFLDAARVDLRFDSDFELIEKVKDVFNSKMSGKEFKEIYPFDVIKGFYKVNKSDVLFKKLKNSRIQRKDENYIGEVLEIKKGSHQAIRLKGRTGIQKGMKLLFITPEGKEFSCPVVELKNTKLEDIEKTTDEGLVLMNYLGGVWVKSQVYIQE